jgi:hypothetical protein
MTRARIKALESDSLSPHLNGRAELEQLNHLFHVSIKRANESGLIGHAAMAQRDAFFRPLSRQTQGIEHAVRGADEGVGQECGNASGGGEDRLLHAVKWKNVRTRGYEPQLTCGFIGNPKAPPALEGRPSSLG